MQHVVEPAASGRSRCRGCRGAIAKGTLRFGEALENPYADGQMTIWYHPACAAYRRPEPFLSVVGSDAAPEDLRPLEATARFASAYPRIGRLGGLERAPSGRARCRHCRELIDSQAPRVPLLFHEEGNFSAGGFIHLGCLTAYVGTEQADPLLACLRHFTAEPAEELLAEAARLL